MFQTIINFFKSLFVKKQPVDQPQPSVDHQEMTTPNQTQNLVTPKPVVNKGNTMLPDYNYLCSVVTLNPHVMENNKAVLAKMLSLKSTYDQIATQLDCDWQLVAGIHFREASLRPNVYLHNGQTLGQRTTIVPIGIFFPSGAFVEASVDALKKAKGAKGFRACCEFAEKHNGLGYRKHGTYSPYVWGQTNNYKSGMYVADGKFDPMKSDARMGMAAIYLCLAEISK